MIVYYNPRCSKCREAKELLEEQSCEFGIREYLKEPPTIKELKALLKKLGCSPLDIVRKSEPLFKEKFSGKKYTNAQWLKILSENPVLIERPIIIDGDRAIVGRPPSLIVDFVKRKK